MITDHPPLQLRKRLLSRSDQLVLMPEVAKKAMELSRQMACSTSEFASVVERDPNLATMMLTIANSAALGGRKPIADLRQTIVRLGFRQCRHLIIAASTASLMKKAPDVNQSFKNALWQHSLFTATVATCLNRELELKFDGEQYTAGLIHDFGRLLMAVAEPKTYPLYEHKNAESNQEILNYEQNEWGVDHCAFGAWYAEHSGLPASMVSVMRWHHQPDGAVEQPSLVALTAASDTVARYYERTGSLRSLDSEPNPAIDTLDSHFPYDVRRRYYNLNEQTLDDIEESLQNALGFAAKS